MKFVIGSQESCRLGGGPLMRAEVAREWLAALPRQQRRALQREAKKRGDVWLYGHLRYPMWLARQQGRR